MGGHSDLVAGEIKTIRDHFHRHYDTTSLQMVAVDLKVKYFTGEPYSST
jgi:hypothetical protein